MIKIDSLIKEYNLYHSSGKDIDLILKIFLFTLKDIKRQYQIIFDMVTFNPQLWIKFAKDADEVYEKEKCLIAEYKPCKEYPFYRIYCYRYTEEGALAKEAFINFLGKELKTIDNFILYNRYNDKEIEKQYILWEEKFTKRLSALTTLANGRIDNTKIEQTIIIDRQPSGCVVCGQKATGYISTVLMHEKVIFMVAHTCDEHQQLAQDHPSFLHFLSKLFQMGIDFPTLNMQNKINNDLINLLSSELQRELQCKLNKPIKYNETKDEFTLTFQKDNGIFIILRLHTLMDYAYMINTPNGKPYQRIDSAPDHQNIQFFPDHLHKTIKKNNKPDVESSYTLGFPLLDIPALQKMINKLEQNNTLI